MFRPRIFRRMLSGQLGKKTTDANFLKEVSAELKGSLEENRSARRQFQVELKELRNKHQSEKKKLDIGYHTENRKLSIVITISNVLLCFTLGEILLLVAAWDVWVEILGDSLKLRRLDEADKR